LYDSFSYRQLNVLTTHKDNNSVENGRWIVSKKKKKTKQETKKHMELRSNQESRETELFKIIFAYHTKL
jgi:hypothetical protein